MRYNILYNLFLTFCMDSQTFKKIFKSEYEENPFLEPYSFLLMKKMGNTLEFDVSNYYPEPVPAGAPYPEVEKIPLEELEKYKNTIKDFIYSIDSDIDTIVINDITI